jgi:hypothetical protein
LRLWSFIFIFIFHNAISSFDVTSFSLMSSSSSKWARLSWMLCLSEPQSLVNQRSHRSAVYDIESRFVIILIYMLYFANDVGKVIDEKRIFHISSSSLLKHSLPILTHTQVWWFPPRKSHRVWK